MHRPWAWLPALILLWGGLRQLWLGDDGFINIRVAQQLLAGNGFVFNAGERVEAVTSALWVFLLTFVGGLGVRLEDAAMGLGLVLSVLGITLSCAASSHWMRSRAGEGSFLPFGALAYAALPAAWDYVTSGLENALGLTWFGACLWLTARAWESTSLRRLLLAASLVGIAPLVRPDYALLGAPLGALLVYAAPTLRARLQVALAGIAPGLAYQIFRMGYFAALTPNTALAKEAFESSWNQGFYYLWNTVGLYWLWVPLACVLMALSLVCNLRRRAAWVGLAAALGGLLHLLYVVRVGGDFMHARLLLPGLFALLSSVAVVPASLASASATRWLRGLFVVLAGWALVCGAALRVAAENEHGIGDERGWHARMAQVANPYRIEHYEKFFFYTSAQKTKRRIEALCDGLSRVPTDAAREHCRRSIFVDTGYGRLMDKHDVLPLLPGITPDDVVAVVASRPLGIAGVVLGPRVQLADAYGLAEPFAARLTITRRGRPGHEKQLPTFWFVARYGAAEATRDLRVARAKRALLCPDLRELDAAIREPLSLARFMRNLRLAPRLQALRVPEDPIEAQRQLCKE